MRGDLPSGGSDPHPIHPDTRPAAVVPNLASDLGHLGSVEFEGSTDGERWTPLDSPLA